MTDLLGANVFNYFSQGGFFMYPILAVSIFGSIIFTERFLAFRFRFGVDARRIFNEVKKFLHAGDMNRAIETCRQYPLSPVAQVLSAGLQNSNRSLDEIETAMEAEALFYLPKINERIPYLAALSNLSTLLGLLGTISGLIASFAAVGGVQNLEIAKEEALAGGIAVAMTTTAFGLIVAIPMLLMHQYIASQATHLVDDLQHYATALKKLLQRMKDERGDKLQLQSFLDDENRNTKTENLNIATAQPALNRG